MAIYYWVGGDGTWDNSNTTNWSLTSGGLPGVAVPTSTDTVIFDSASGTGTCTTASGSACAAATLNSSTLGVTLGADHTMSGTFTLTLGTLSLGTFILTCNIFSSNSASARTINFDTGKIVLTGNATTIANIFANNLTATGVQLIEANYSGSSGTRVVTLGGATEANAISLSVTAGTDTVTLTNSNTVRNLNFTGFSGTLTNAIRTIYGNLIVSSGMTLTAGTSATTFAATSGTQQITTNGKTLDFPITQNGVGGTVQLQDNLTMGSTRTFTLTNGALDLNNLTLSTGLFSSSNSNARSIAFGTGNITVTGNNTTVWTTSIVTNFSYTGTPTVNFTYAGATGTRQITTGNGTEAQVLNYNITAGTDGIGFISAVGSLNFTGFSGTYSQSTTQLVLYKDITFSTGMTITGGTGILYFFSASSTQNITCNGKTINCPIYVGYSTTQTPNVICQDALTQDSTKAFTFANGTIQLKNGVTSTVGAFTTSGTTQKYLKSTTAGSQATLSQASGTVNASYLAIQDINATGGATFNALWSNNNVDLGDNAGWYFGDQPIINAVEYTYKLRSFTQPRRF